MKTESTAEDQVLGVLDGSVGWEGCDAADDRLGLSGERRRLGLKILNEDQPAIGGDTITVTDLDDVTDDEIDGGNFHFLSVADDGALLR